MNKFLKILKNFLFFKNRHKFEITCVARITMSPWYNIYEVFYYCALCGRIERKLTYENYLVSLGFSAEKLRKMKKDVPTENIFSLKETNAFKFIEKI